MRGAAAILACQLFAGASTTPPGVTSLPCGKSVRDVIMDKSVGVDAASRVLFFVFHVSRSCGGEPSAPLSVSQRILVGRKRITSARIKALATTIRYILSSCLFF